MEGRPDPRDFVWPSPTIWLVFVSIIVSGILVYGAAYALGLSLDTLLLCPALAIAAAACYLALLWLTYRRDPRIWLDATTFAEIVQSAYPAWEPLAGPDNARFSDHLRAVAWRDGTLTMAQQAGIAAAAAAWTPAIFQGEWLLGLAVLLGTFLAVRWLVRTMLGARDREVMAARLVED